MKAMTNICRCTCCSIWVGLGRNGVEYPYALRPSVLAEIDAVDDILCITCANALSISIRGQPLEYADFDPAGYSYDDTAIDLPESWLSTLHPVYRAALLRGSPTK